MKKIKLFSFICLISAFIIGLFQSNLQAEEAQPIVYVIPIEKEVERGLEAFLKRSLNEAIDQGADHVVFEVNTPGGFVDAAGNIAQLIRDFEIRTTAFIVKDALSAGAYISLNADEIVMTPGSRMGAAAVIDQEGNMADEKAVSAWLADMKASAELNDRDPLYALAMVDPDIDLPEYGAEKGTVLTLTANQALEVGYTEAVVEDRNELLEYLNLSDATVIESEITLSEQIARFITHPIIVPILLTLGSLGLVLELYSPGFGIPGTIGLLSLFLFFFGHAIAGFAGWEALILFIAGIILIVVEIFTPGFGIFGISGIVAILISIFLSSSVPVSTMLLYMLIAIIVTLAVSVLYIRVFGYRGFLKKLVLTDATKTELGYVSNEAKEDLVGQTGITVTPLRPSGIVEINHKRYDVVSESSYIEKDKTIIVVKSEGLRIVVKELKES